MIDLMCVEEDGAKTLTCGIVGEEGTEDRTLGPVPYSNGVGVLAEMLYGAMPGRFVDLREARNLLAEIHRRNVVHRKNAAGTPYPHRMNERDRCADKIDEVRATKKSTRHPFSRWKILKSWFWSWTLWKIL